MTWRELTAQLEAWEKQKPGILDEKAQYFDGETDPIEIDTLDPYVEDPDDEDSPTTLTVGP